MRGALAQRAQRARQWPQLCSSSTPTLRCSPAAPAAPGGNQTPCAPGPGQLPAMEEEEERAPRHGFLVAVKSHLLMRKGPPGTGGRPAGRRSRAWQWRRSRAQSCPQRAQQVPALSSACSTAQPWPQHAQQGPALASACTSAGPAAAPPALSRAPRRTCSSSSRSSCRSRWVAPSERCMSWVTNPLFSSRTWLKVCGREGCRAAEGKKKPDRSFIHFTAWHCAKQLGWPGTL